MSPPEVHPPQPASAWWCTAEAPCPHAAEVEALRAENAWLRQRLAHEETSWRLLRVSSPLTTVRFGSTLGPTWYDQADPDGRKDDGESEGTSVTVAWSSRQLLPVPVPPDDDQRREGANWRWWPMWCPCCRRPLDVTAFRGEVDWESAEQVDRARRAEEAAPCSEEAAEEEAGRQEPRPWAEEAADEEGGGQEPRACAEEQPWAAEPRPPLAEPFTAAAEPAAEGAAPATASSAPAPRFAYVAALWGYNPGYILGALVLGVALRRSGSRHDLVLLHTDDIAQSACEMLAEVWQLRQVDYVLADSTLFAHMGSRFDGVFTKLHALGLTEYAKVLVLDLDLAVLACPDELFDLPAPAAMHRAVRGAAHGTRVEGRHFFAGESLDADASVYEWGQAGGINAGVMLFAPDGELYERVLQEVCLPVHPEHIPGNGPEQDYLSRLFAPWWTHIGVAYNYQLHRTFHSLEGAVVAAPTILAAGRGDDGAEGTSTTSWAQPERLALRLEELRLVHFSGQLKMWDGELLGGQEDDEFAEQLLRDCAGHYCRLWLDRAGWDSEYEEFGLRLEEGHFVHSDPQVGRAVTPLVEHAVGLALGSARLAVTSWRDALRAVPAHGARLPPLPTLLERLQRPESQPGVRFPWGARVEVWTRSNWYAATVRATHEDYTVSVEFDEAGFWGCGQRHIRPHLVRLMDGEDAGSIGHDVA